MLTFRVLPSVLGIVLCAAPVHAQHQPLDDFTTIGGWHAVTSHGDASRLELRSGPGNPGGALEMDFSFLGYMGSAAAEKRLRIPLPDNYAISFDLRAEAPVNNFVIRLMDSLDNVWWVNRSNYTFPRVWTRFTIKKHQIQYGWGPSGGGDPGVLDRIMIMIDVVEGGAGRIWIDNLRIEPLEAGTAHAPGVRVSSSVDGRVPVALADPRSIGPWRSGGRGPGEWLEVDLGRTEVLGGVVIDWDTLDHATSFEVQLSRDRLDWTTRYTVSGATGRRSYIPLDDGECRYARIVIAATSRGRGCGIRNLRLRGPEFSFSENDLFAAIAAEAPRGLFPRYLSNEQSYWTVIGAPADRSEALINEEGMIETNKLAFTLDPFIHTGGRLLTWNDASLSQWLEDDHLPMPVVQWLTPDSLRLRVHAFAGGPAGASVLYARYTLANRDRQHRTGTLYIAARPFQVNPPWQVFTIVGGVSRIDSMSFDGTLRVNGSRVIPLSLPAAAGVAAFDQGQITAYLQDGIVPPAVAVTDPAGHASGALMYPFELAAGDSMTVLLAVPFHAAYPAFLDTERGTAAAARVAAIEEETRAFWHRKVAAVDLALPPVAGPLQNTIRANLAWILINADGAGTQPGSRSYERSWIRDGALTSAALLQMGIRDEVRHYLDWYAGYQFPDGTIPCVVEPRGPEPTPEHDSHGQFLYAVAQYFLFTRDTVWLRGKWDHVRRTVSAIRNLRGQRTTELYRTGTAEQRACYGLMPASISHEGYCPKPMHSYWDDFFTLRGLKDAAVIAAVLGEREAARDFTAERDSLRKALAASIRLAMENANVQYIPGCAELGDFSGLSTTVAITPCDEAEVMPPDALAYTFDESWRMFRERARGTIAWDAYLPYEARFIGAFVHLGQRDRALAFLDQLMNDRRPHGWHHWAEVVWREERKPKSIGDMPHSWAASDFIRSVRSLFAIEREQDGALVLGAGIPDSWLDDPAGVRITGLPTFYGNVSFSMRRTGGAMVVEADGPATDPPGGVRILPPATRPLLSVEGDGVPVPETGEILLTRRPARCILRFAAD